MTLKQDSRTLSLQSAPSLFLYLMSEASQKLPRHVACIMDGNGRWAEARGLPRRKGHREGAESVQACVESCLNLGIEYLTLYAFSSENWERPASEVSALMSLLEQFLKQQARVMQRKNVRLIAIGQLDRLPEKTRKVLDKVLAETANNTALTLVLALSYGGREEITDAVKRLASQVQSGDLQIDEISKSHIDQALYTAGIPDPDLLIRTSGEMRLSNFLLWQLSYTEIYVTQQLWPDFREDDFKDALQEFSRRQRRYGRVEVLEA